MVADEIVGELVHYLGGRCALCDKPYPDAKTWTIHHRKYRCADCGAQIRSRDRICPGCGGKPELKYSDFQEKMPYVVTRGKYKGKNKMRIIRHKLEYYNYLRKVIMNRDHAEQDFAAMHHYCHVSLKYGTLWGLANGNRQRYCDLIMEQA